MANKKTAPPKLGGAQPRASITFPPEVYKTLSGLARDKKVSIAWVVREAVEQYIAAKTPLFSTREGV
jgi:predicted DNA-binding protein